MIAWQSHLSWSHALAILILACFVLTGLASLIWFMFIKTPRDAHRVIGLVSVRELRRYGQSQASPKVSRAFLRALRERK
jgi:hypothetical protein